MLELVNLSRHFSRAHAGLGPVDLKIGAGEVISIVGPSGCGKSTLLRILAGLETPTGGDALWQGRSLSAISPEERHGEVGVVFQEPRLLPWRTVWENVRLGLGPNPKASHDLLVAAALDKVGLLRVANALPRELSGGMAQRVGIARALVSRPSLVLLDEPFSALDALNRLQLQNHFLQLWEGERKTLLLVTHDLDEALLFGDRVIVLQGHPGRVVADLRIDLPRPRHTLRTEAPFQEWKEQLLSLLHLLPTSRTQSHPLSSDVALA